MNESLRIRGGSSQVLALAGGDRLTLVDLEGGQDALLYAFAIGIVTYGILSEPGGL